ncbi:MAG: S41 family peptidase [Bacteroidales bacterium]|nr:S41 family peptidase [Bacteroidales bacterium]
MKKIFIFLIFCYTVTTTYSQNPTYQQKLYYSCKVWGFVKYFHSKVSNCEVNWDSVLVGTLPLIKNAVTKDDFNNALDTMLNAAGPMDIAVAPLPDTLPPELKRNRNFGWINDSIFRPDVKTLLDTIKNNFRPDSICWVKDNDYSSPSYKGWLVFPYDDPMINYNIYANYPDEFTRLMIIFKYWNIINYFNPYNYALDMPWDSTLYNNILPITTDSDYTGFYKSFKKITANANDEHVELCTYGNVFSFPGYYVPWITLRYIQNNYVVVKSNVAGISKGDVIISIDSKTTTQWEDSLRPYISAGNSSIFKKLMCKYILGGTYNSSIQIVYKDSLGNNETKNSTRIYATENYYPNDTLSSIKWKKWDCNVGFVNMANLQTSDVNNMYNELKNTTSIIFDIRNYPNGTAWPIADLMYPDRRCFSKLTIPDVTYPGTYSWYYDSLGLNSNPSSYTGHVIILCNEETLSQAEFSCMILKAMPNATIVGSQTAGADGNVTSFNLSLDIHTGFTNLGVYYPNGDSTQRIGIVPDSVAYPTIDGVRHGRDEVLEKALEIANCVSSVSEKNQKNNFKIFPNPANNKITIELPQTAKQSTITINNVNGQELFKRQTTNNKLIVDVSKLPGGIYFVKVVNENGVSVGKFVRK